MRHFLLPVLSLLLIVCSCNTSTRPIPEAVTHPIESLRQELAPDRRVARFDVEPVWHNGQLVLRGETNFPEGKQRLLDQLNSTNISYTDSIQLLPSPALAGKTMGVVKLSVANIRSKPKHSAELSTQATLGSVLRVHKQQGDWYLVQTPDNYFGWLDKGGFTLMDQTDYDKWAVQPKVIYLPEFGIAYQSPNAKGVAVSDLVAGNIMVGLYEKSGFTALYFPDGRLGFVPKEQVLPLETWLDSREANGQNILHTAEQFLGRPYLWGGTSGKGVDCSGFTKSVFFQHGIQLERDASLQVHTGIAIDTDTSSWTNLQAGDLLFFGRAATPEKKERITHVAIWMGDGKIIHAAGQVKIESLVRGAPDFAEDRLKTFIRAKRILGSEGQNGVIALKDSKYY